MSVAPFKRAQRARRERKRRRIVRVELAPTSSLALDRFVFDDGTVVGGVPARRPWWRRLWAWLVRA